jgi:hypothetical protein
MRQRRSLASPDRKRMKTRRAGKRYIGWYLQWLRPFSWSFEAKRRSRFPGLNPSAIPNAADDAMQHSGSV